MWQRRCAPTSGLMMMNRELFAGLAASPPLPAHPDNSLAGGSETQSLQLLPCWWSHRNAWGTCGMIKKGERMIQVENAAETGERAWLEENDPFWWPTLSTPFYCAPSYNVLPGEGERKYLIHNRDMNKIHILWPYPGELSSGYSEQCCFWALWSVQGWVVPVGGPSPEIQVNPSPSPLPQPTRAGGRAVHCLLKWAWREHLHPTVLGPEN